MFMTATVLRVNPNSLLVRNEADGQEVLVLVRDTSRFTVGDRISIFHTGQMTASIPPQVIAIAIQNLGQGPIPFPPTPYPPTSASEMRARVTQRGTNYLVVQSLTDRQQYRVEYAFAHHFCVGQEVIVRYDTITLSSPPRITATDILPAC